MHHGKHDHLENNDTHWQASPTHEHGLLTVAVNGAHTGTVSSHIRNRRLKSKVSAQIQSPSCSLSGRYTWLRYWNPNDDSAWISAFSPVFCMISSSFTQSGLA